MNTTDNDYTQEEQDFIDQHGQDWFDRFNEDIEQAQAAIDFIKEHGEQGAKLLEAYDDYIDLAQAAIDLFEEYPDDAQAMLDKHHNDVDDAREELEFLEEHGDLGAALLDGFCSDVDAATEMLRDNYQGCYKSLGDYAQEMTEQCDDIPERLQHYIDWQAMGEDMAGTDIFSIELGREIHIFLNN